MALPRLWTTSQDLVSDPFFRGMRREMENAFRAFDRGSPSAYIGAGIPPVAVAETKDAFEVTAELPGVDEKEWHVEERTYGSFYRSMSLPFKPEDGAVEAHFDKGVLHLTIKKPTKVIKSSKTIDVKTGAPPNKA